jgi:hypothetical protein
MKKTIDLTIPSAAIFSDDRKYRYILARIWHSDPILRLLIGLNPSTADEFKNDPTVIRDMKRAARDGFGGILRVNLYAFCSSHPEVLLGDGDYVGAENDNYIKLAISITKQHVCGWGSFPAVYKRAPEVLKMIPTPYCLGVNSDGQPQHPLYISYKTPVMKYVLDHNNYSVRSD